LKQRLQNLELSASAVEFIPRPIRDRKKPGKFEDYEVKFVRTIRAKRLHNNEESPSTDERDLKDIWNSDFTATDPKFARLNAKRLNPYVRILHQTRIEMDQSAGSVIDQSAAATGPRQQSPIAPPMDAQSTCALAACTHTRCPSTESAHQAPESNKRRRSAQLDNNLDREHIDTSALETSASEFGETDRTDSSGADSSDYHQETDSSDDTKSSKMAKTKQMERKGVDGFKCHVCGKIYRQHFGRKRHLGIKHWVDESNNTITQDEHDQLLKYNRKKPNQVKSVVTDPPTAGPIGTDELTAAIASISPPPAKRTKTYKSAEFVEEESDESEFDSDFSEDPTEVVQMPSTDPKPASPTLTDDELSDDYLDVTNSVTITSTSTRTN